MKPFEVFCTEKTQSFKKPKPRKDTQNKSLYLLHLFLLLVQRGAVQLQQRGGDTHCQVVGVHLIGVSVLEDVMEDADEMLQEEFVGSREVVHHPIGGEQN